jgi:hypothetical protein
MSPRKELLSALTSRTYPGMSWGAFNYSACWVWINGRYIRASGPYSLRVTVRGAEDRAVRLPFRVDAVLETMRILQEETLYNPVLESCAALGLDPHRVAHAVFVVVLTVQENK